jgi:ribonucleoside-diphosphate reductase alpha chain
MTHMNVTKRDGSTESLDIEKIHKVTEWACHGLAASQSELEIEANLLFFPGIKTSQIHDALINAAAGLNSVENQDYTFVAGRLLLQKIYKEAWNSISYPRLSDYIEKGVAGRRLDSRLLGFNLDALQSAIKPERDLQFTYIGLQTLADRYFVRDDRARVIELPQHFYMRVAMGLALQEKDEAKDAWAIAFYDLLSSHAYHSSTPTLFNAGTLHSQLASCFLNTVADTITNDEGTHRYASIYGTIEECAILSKYAGGVGTDWQRVRDSGSYILGTHGKSTGIVPFLKVYNDTAVAVNQGGKRQGSFAPYIEPTHPDLYAFIDLKKESGDDRTRAHDIYPALWMPDMFFKRKEQRGMWSFFSPNKYPELHELWGDAYERRYEELEAAGSFTHQIPAIDVWKKILGSLFETGHPWITFKDECNRRSPQQHAGVVHSSNLCTEITLNTSDDETAVCNIGSVNLAKIKDLSMLGDVVKVAMRMLDNVIDINYYGSDRAKASNLRHRPVGLGLMGYTEYLVARGVDWESQEHLEAADELLESFSYFAIDASCDLARERGTYGSFEGSLWSQGIFPIDTAKEAGKALTSRELSRDWDLLRSKVKQFGMRNSNTMAIAPTATISNIVGTTATIEPIFQREVTKKNMSGSFIVTDPCLRYGRPELCKEAFDIDPMWLIKAAAVRQKWLDQAQSTNIFVKSSVKGKDLDVIYTTAHKLGLKTTYYLRGQSADLKKAEVGAVIAAPAATEAKEEVAESQEAVFCSIDNPDCEACQ